MSAHEVLATHPKEYYDKVARKYSSMITSGVGGNMKRREMDCLMTLLSPKKGETILDAGCGSGFYAKLIRNSGAKILCVDISSEMVETVRRTGLEAEVHDIESMDLGRKFDKILCAGPLEFCRNPAKALRNLRHHVTNEGCMVLSTLSVSPFGFVYWIYHLSHGLRINLFSLRWIVRLLEEAKFKIETIQKPTSFLYVIKTKPL